MKKIILTAIILVFSNSAFALSCHGTEPFWSAEVTNEKVSLNLVGGDEEEILTINNVQAALGFTADFISTYSDLRGPVAVVKAATCNNGMSDDEFGKEVMIFTSTGTLYGCCGPAL